MNRVNISSRILTLVSWLFLAHLQLGGVASAKIDCGPVTNKSNDLPRTIAIGSNLPGTGAHALASGLAAVASKVTPISAKVQPYNGPNAWMPLLDNGELEFGIINILDSYMAATGTGNYKRLIPLSVWFPVASSPSLAASWFATSQTSNSPVTLKVSGWPGTSVVMLSPIPGRWLLWKWAA